MIEYMVLVGKGGGSAFSFEFISQIVLIILLGLAVVIIGYKIKEGWGAFIAFLICSFFFLYINGLLWDLFRYFI